MSDSIKQGGTLKVVSGADESVTITIKPSPNPQHPGKVPQNALVELKAVIRKWAQDYNVDVDVQGPP